MTTGALFLGVEGESKEDGEAGRRESSDVVPLRDVIGGVVSPFCILSSPTAAFLSFCYPGTCSHDS